MGRDMYHRFICAWHRLLGTALNTLFWTRMIQMLWWWEIVRNQPLKGLIHLAYSLQKNVIDCNGFDKSAACIICKPTLPCLQKSYVIRMKVIDPTTLFTRWTRLRHRYRLGKRWSARIEEILQFVSICAWGNQKQLQVNGSGSDSSNTAFEGPVQGPLST